MGWCKRAPIAALRQAKFYLPTAVHEAPQYTRYQEKEISKTRTDVRPPPNRIYLSFFIKCSVFDELE